jgi:hypothetical protein
MAIGIAADLFGEIQGAVRGGDQLTGLSATHWIRGDTDARGYLHEIVAQVEGLFYCAQETPGDQLLVASGDIFRHHGKLVPAQSTYGFASPVCQGQALRDTFEQHVPLIVLIGIVDGFQSIEVHE